MGVSKTRIDRLGDRLKGGQIEKADLQLLDEYRRSFSDAHDMVTSTIRDRLTLQPTGRPAKSTAAIVDKLRRESIRLSQIQDIAGCRVVVSDVREQDRAVASVRALFERAEVIDRRERPSHGYRAVHVVVVQHGKVIEIQIRSLLQHLWAELSEKFADAFGPSLKYGLGDDKVRTILSNLSTMVEREEADERLRPEDERGGLTDQRRAIILLLKGVAFDAARTVRSGEAK